MSGNQDESEKSNSSYKNNIIWYLLVAILSIILFMLLQKLVCDSWYPSSYHTPACHNASFRFVN
jgi:hypothetical protein